MFGKKKQVGRKRNRKAKQRQTYSNSKPKKDGSSTIGKENSSKDGGASFKISEKNRQVKNENSKLREEINSMEGNVEARRGSNISSAPRFKRQRSTTKPACVITYVNNFVCLCVCLSPEIIKVFCSTGVL
jgi:hypothetical protein